MRFDPFPMHGVLEEAARLMSQSQSAGNEDADRGEPSAGPATKTTETGEPVAGPTLAQTGPPPLSQWEIENVDHLLPYLSYSATQLAISGIPVTRLWDGLRPTLLYLPDRAVDNYRTIRAAFGRYFDVSVYCAVKACYVAGVLSALRAAGAGAEIASEFEWRIVRSIGFPPERTVANGTCRPARHMDCLLREESVLIDIDGEEELERSEWHARRSGVKPATTIRVNPLPPDAYFSERSKLGAGEDAAYQLLERAARSPYLDLRGLHAHQLVHCTDPEQYGRLARRMGELANALTAASGTRLEILNLGGGLESRFLLERAGHTIDDFATAAHDALAGMGNLRVLLEPGRYIFGDAALALTAVLGRKHKAGADWLITEVGCNVLPATSDRAYPPVPLRLTPGQAWRQLHVADPTPAPSRLCLDALLPTDAAAHGLALIGCGAYTAVRASLWGTDLPDISLLRNGRAEIVFDRSAQDAAVRSLYGVDPNAAN
jgi:diaminopimelate decarboxylase